MTVYSFGTFELQSNWWDVTGSAFCYQSYSASTPQLDDIGVGGAIKRTDPGGLKMAGDYSLLQAGATITYGDSTGGQPYALRHGVPSQSQGFARYGTF